MARLKAAQRREQLIEVATKLFARNGYEATTTAAIALAAGVTEPILYRHFRNKQDLFVAIVRSVSDRTMRHWRDLIADTNDPEEQIRRIAEEFTEHITQLDDAYHVLHGALASSRDKKVLAVIKQHYREIERFFSQVVSSGQKAGVFRKNMSPKMPAWQLIMTGIGYAMIALNLWQFDDALIREEIDATIRGMKS